MHLSEYLYINSDSIVCRLSEDKVITKLGRIIYLNEHAGTFTVVKLMKR